MKGTFQIIVVIIFIAAAIFGILVFSGAIPLGNTSTQATGTVVMWGTVKSSTMAPLLEDFNRTNSTFTVTYVEKSPQNFDQNLLEALATGVGPDMFLLPDNLTFHYANKIFTIPYASYPLVTFKNTFAGAGEVFLNSNGLLAFPLTIDPLVLYYNRSTFDSNGIIYPPKTWNELATMVQTLTKKDSANKILEPGVALGHFSNVTHAKDILAAMFMQAGNTIVATGGGATRSTLSDLNSTYDMTSVLQFYTDFADPVKPVYSWSRSFPDSINAFSSEDVPLYFGFASELRPLLNKNPNQNFGVAPIPQIDGSPVKVTGSHVTGVAISAASKNLTTAFTAASLMATGDFAAKLSSILGIAPARRDLLALKPKDAYSPIFYDSALYAKSWRDPSSPDTDSIFRNMIDAVLSNNLKPKDAIDDASSKLDLLLLK